MKYGVVALRAGVVVIAVVSVLLLYVMMADKPEPSPVSWSLGADDPVAKLIPSGDSMFIVSAANVSMVNSSGYTIWSHACEDTRFSSMCPDGSLIAYSGGSGLFRFYENGTYMNFSVPQVTEAPLGGPDGTSFIRIWDRMSAILPDGKEAWNISKVVFGPVLADGALYAVMRDPVKGCSLSYIGINGTLLWDLHLNSHNVSGIASDGASGVFIYDGAAGTVIRVDPSGTMLWSYVVPGGGQLRYVRSDDGRHGLLSHGTVYVLDRDGSLASKFNHNLSMAGTESPVAIDGDTVYVAGPGNSTDTFVLYALRPDGSVRWSRLSGGSAPVNIYALNGTICAATELMDGHRLRPVLYVLNESSADTICYFSEDGRPWAQVVIVPGHVYARTFGGRLFAFDA